MIESASKNQCPVCNEPVKPAWRICPACETRLQALACPVCGGEVKENWRRCPECEAVLICAGCGRRPTSGKPCPQCNPAEAIRNAPPPIFTDPICGIDFLFIKGGLFQMGDTLDQGIPSELPVHPVVLDDFYMSRTPVTQAQWGLLMKDNPSRFEHPQNPVEQITWADACDFAHKLSTAGKTGAVFTLPTEAQWEYAARSGGKEELYAGGSNIDAVAWYDESSMGRAHPVGRKKPNGLGLYDMSGNVWEWCLDTFFPDAYAQHAGRNPVVSSSGPDRVIRGGGWNLDAWSARCARRFNFPADCAGPALGFRLVMIYEK